MKKIISLIVILSIIIIGTRNIQAQMSVSVPQLIGVNPGSIIDIPVWGNNWNQINNVCITIEYDPVVLTYNGYNTLDPILQFPILVNTNGRIRFASFMTTGSITFLADTLFHLEFIYNSGCSPLTFDTDTTSPYGCYWPIANNGSVNCYVSTPDYASEEIAFQVYPNPASDKINVVFTPVKIENNSVLQIIDDKGEILDEKIIKNCNNEIQIKTSGLATGHYNVCLLTRRKQPICKPFIIKR